jgi:hypothetical protein
MKSSKYLLIITVGVLILGLHSCKKRRANRSTITSQDNAAAEAAFNDVFKITEDALKDNDLEKSAISLKSIGANCATVSVNPPFPDTTFPKTVTIDFGATNCTDAYGVNRRGVITAVITGKYRDVGSSISITTQDYYVNDIKVEGVKEVVNLGPNSSGNTEFSVNISNAKITYTNGDFVKYESARIREWVIGESTQGLLGVLDDEYDITGTASGEDRNGLPYTMTITSPLRVAVLCRWVKQGTVEIQPDGLYLRTVDFGTGDCDAAATVEINGNVYNFSMN